MKHTFVIPGNPTALARARINPKAFFTNVKRKMWDPQKEIKLVTAITLENQFNSVTPFTGPVQLDAIFYMPIPKSKSTKNKDMLNGTYHVKVPDLSNLLKFIEDAAAGILYNDDCIISYITVQKKYDNNPRTEFTLISLKEPND